MSKLIAIYSVWTDGYWIDNLDNNREWIFIYENSRPLLTSINVGDIILLNITWDSKWILFKIQDKEQIITNYNGWEEDKIWSAYIVIDEDSKKIFDLSIVDFKNLYFLNIDYLKSWVRSPLATRNNILIFEKDYEIISDFISYDKLKEVLDPNQIGKYLRKYIFTKSDKNKNIKKLLGDNNENIVTLIEDEIFKKEYSCFHPDWFYDEDILVNFDKKFSELEKKFWKQNKKKIENIRKDKFEFTLFTYSSYYDISRVAQNKVDNTAEIADVSEIMEEIIEEGKRKLNKLGEEIKKNTDNPKEREELLKEQEEIRTQIKEKAEDKEKVINEDVIKELKDKKMGVEIQHHNTIMDLMYKIIKDQLEWNINQENEKNINNTLSALRLIYIMDWKEWAGNFKEIWEVVNTFDKFLENYQIREQKKAEDKANRDQKDAEFSQRIKQKNDIFAKVQRLFYIELGIVIIGILLLIIIWKLDFNNLYTISFISILLTSTLAQITIMFYHIVKNLFPLDSSQVDKLPSIDFTKTVFEAATEKIKAENKNNKEEKK